MANSATEQLAEYAADLADGDHVWCEWADQPGYTADGHCEYCGGRGHPQACGRCGDPLLPDGRHPSHVRGAICED